MPITEEQPCRLDPKLGQPIPFQRRGKSWVLAGRPCRLAARIVNGKIEVFDPKTGDWCEDEAP